MLCKKCGKENEENSQFCTRCGSPLTDNEQRAFGSRKTVDENIKRSKIYSYFYGSNTVFQQFVIVVGILCLMMANVANEAAASNIFSFLGKAAILVGIVWFVYKKITFEKSGEYVYDQELREKIEEAKRKGMDKLNIISEQIERVEPVVLNGIAHVDNDIVSAIVVGKLGALFQKMFKFILSFDKIIIGLIGSSVLTTISIFLVSKNIPFIIVFLLVFGGVGYLGYLIYKKYEIDSHINPKTIERLNKFEPNFMAKLGSDNKVRVSLPAITVYMFGDDQLYVYYQYLDIVTGKIFCEGVHEYFYEDIVGITSSQETRKIFKRCGFMNLFLRSVDYLKENITVVSSGCMHKESYVVDIGHSLLDTQFVGMRNLIRQKKMEK